MEVEEYNERLQSEVNEWKAKVDDVIGKFDKMPSEDREKALPFFDELHRSIEGLTARIEELNSTLREEDKTKKEVRFSRFKKVWKELWSHELPYFRYPHL